MIDAFIARSRIDDVELWIHTCWGNPNMQRVMEDTSYAIPSRSIWTVPGRRVDGRDEGSESEGSRTV